MICNGRGLVCALALMCVFSTARVMSVAAEENSHQIKEVQVVSDKAEIKGTLTVPSNHEALQEIQTAPGGVNMVPVERFEKNYTVSFEDTLALVPGAFAQKRFGEEVRLSIRGSGLARTFHLLGLMVFQDGVPFTRPDGSGDFQEADSLAFQRIELFKGGNALQYGGNTLGGAINLVTKNGRSNPGHLFRFETGSDETFRINVQSGYEFERSDLFVSLTGTTSDDFREHSHQENIKFNSNYGIRLSDKVESRFYLSTNILAQELPGTITLGTVQTMPESANQAAITTDWQRDFNSVRVANKTTFDLGDNRFLDVGAYFNHKNMFHPITPFAGVVDQESEDYGVYATARGSYHLGNFLNNFRAGFLSQFGHTDALLFQNIGGHRGNLIGDQDQFAFTNVWFGENHFYVLPEVALITGGQVVFAGRESDNNLAPARSDSDTFVTFNPRVGVMYQPTEDLQVFANVTRSYEPPDFGNLTQGGTAGFTPVAAQHAWTGEIGTRGQYGPMSWDLVFYRAWIDDELLQFTPGPGFPAATFNAGDTIHQGVEVGLNFILGENLLMGGDRLQWRNAYTYSDFYFESDAQYGNNNIPGQPPHFYQTEFRYDHRDGWFIAPNVEFASSAFVDFTNTLKAPDYAILGFGAGYTVNPNLDLFVNARNLLDEEYVSTFSPINTPTAFNTATFYPGDDRRVFGGVRVKF